jgi:hypothetical protein
MWPALTCLVSAHTGKATKYTAGMGKALGWNVLLQWLVGKGDLKVVGGGVTIVLFIFIKLYI